jgi:hypothetical protein
VTILAAHVYMRRLPYNVSIQGRIAMSGGSARKWLQRQINDVRPWNPESNKKPSDDPRIRDLGRAIENDFATLRDSYGHQIDTPFAYSTKGANYAQQQLLSIL